MEMVDPETYRSTDGLVSGIMPDGKIRVVQGLFTSDTLRGIEVKELGQQVDGQGVGTGEELGERNPSFDGEGTDVILSLHQRIGELVCSR